MALSSWWSAITRWLGGGLQRRQGLQVPGPLEYDGEAAARVTFDTAMQLSAVWACVKLLSETVASLPLAMYRRRDGRRTVDKRDHPIAMLLDGMPNGWQTSVEFWECVLVNLLMHGNAFIQVQRMASGRVVALVPLMSAQMEVTLLADGTVVYAYSTSAGVIVYARESIWHLKLMGNGVIGLSPLDHMRNTAGIAIGAEKAVTKIYRNGAKPSGVLSLDKLLTPEQREQIRANFATLTTGNDNRLLVLELGAKFEPIAMSPQDIELLASRRFQVEEIARWFGVPSVLINDTSSSTVWGSGIEQIVLGFYKLTLRPILEKIEASMRCHLLTPAERRDFEFEFDFEGLLRADMKSRFEGDRIGVQGGFLKPNEARRYEGLDDAAGGDVLYMQGATVPIDLAGKPAPAAPLPAGKYKITRAADGSATVTKHEG